MPYIMGPDKMRSIYAINPTKCFNNLLSSFLDGWGYGTTVRIVYIKK